MPRKNNKRAFSETILREVKKEMAKPRLAESVRRAQEARNALRSVPTRFSAIVTARDDVLLYPPLASTRT